MRSHVVLAAASAFLISPALGVFVDEAYQVDFHYSLLGEPKESNTFFHQPVRSSKASLLYTLSEKGFVGAVNPKDGQIVWRHDLARGNNSRGANGGFLRTAEGQDTVISALGTSVSAWSAADGRLVWDRKFGTSVVHGLDVVDPSHGDAASTSTDTVIAVQGEATVVYKLNGQTGAVEWTYEDTSGDVAHSLSASKTYVHLLSIHKTKLLRGLKLKVTTIDLIKGTKTDQHTLNTDGDISSADEILFSGPASGIPIVAWADSAKKAVKINVLGTKDVQHVDVLDARRESLPVERITVHAHKGPIPTTNFLVNYQTAKYHWADLMSIDQNKGSKVTKLDRLNSADGDGTFSASSVDGKLYFVGITDDELIVHSPDTKQILERRLFKEFNVPGLVDKPSPVFAASEVALRGQSSYAVRSAVLLSTGDWVLIRNSEIGWSRPEQLAGVIRAEWAELNEPEVLEREKAVEGGSNAFSAFSHRLRRHLHDLQSLQASTPNLLRSIVDRITGLDKRSAQNQALSTAFGFNKIVVTATENGRFVALDVGDKGRVVWSINGKRSGDTSIPKLPWKPSDFRNGLNSQLNLAQFQDAASNKPIWSIKTGLQNQQLRLYESVQAAGPDAPNFIPSEPTKYAIVDGILQGYIGKRKTSLWAFSPPQGQRLISVTAPFTGEPVASIGKALGDRSVLYKYLNPNAILATAIDDEKKIAVVTLLDAVSGNVLYTTLQKNVDTSRPIASTISENWFAFSYTMDSPDDSVSKGYQIVMTEMYESSIPNDRGAFGSLANYSTTQATAPPSEPHVFLQSFHIPEEISHMAVTQTGQGITSRQLIVGLAASNSIVGIPHHVLDPRRPVGRDPTREQMEEGLSRYSPMIDFDPTWYLNHQEEVFGIQKIITTAASLESTSMIFAYGHDLFGTRVTPSFSYDKLGTTFNKIQLVITVLALLVGVFFVAPLIQRKQTNMLWQAS